VELAAENADFCNKLAALYLKAIVRMPREFNGRRRMSSIRCTRRSLKGFDR